MPFDDSNVGKMLRTILTKPVAFPSRMIERIVPNCKALIAHILQPDVTRRATMEQICSSEWLKKLSNSQRPTSSRAAGNKQVRHG